MNIPEFAPLNPSLGASLGAGLGQGLSQGLDDLIKAEVEKRKTAGTEKLKQQSRIEEAKAKQQIKEDFKKAEKEEELAASRQRASSILNVIDQLIEEGNVGATAYAKQFGLSDSPKRREALGELKQYSQFLETQWRDQVNKGTMSKVVFDYLKDNLIQGSDTLATMKGKSKGLKALMIMTPQELEQHVLERTGKSPSKKEKPPLSSFWSDKK